MTLRYSVYTSVFMHIINDYDMYGRHFPYKYYRE